MGTHQRGARHEIDAEATPCPSAHDTMRPMPKQRMRAAAGCGSCCRVTPSCHGCLSTRPRSPPTWSPMRTSAHCKPYRRPRDKRAVQQGSMRKRAYEQHRAWNAHRAAYSRTTHDTPMSHPFNAKCICRAWHARYSAGGRNLSALWPRSTVTVRSQVRVCIARTVECTQPLPARQSALCARSRRADRR